MNKEILRIAVPSIISNVTVPLLGLVDLTIVGHIGGADYISAIATGSMIFNIIYWLFGFLRMGTGGMTAQANGRKNANEAEAVLRKSLSTGVIIGLAFISLQAPVFNLMAWAMNTPATALAYVSQYFSIVVWGAPAMLSLYAMNGWFIGMQDTRTPMVVAILQNIINIIASLLFVFALEWKIEGVAAGTLIAQWSGTLMAATAVTRKKLKLKLWSSKQYSGTNSYDISLRRFFTVNRDIFLRTLCLVAVNLFFTSAGGRQGPLILAVNSLLLTLYTLFSYIMDGFAYAGEAMSGKYYGSNDYINFNRLTHYLYIWGGLMTILFTLLYIIGGKGFLGILTDDTVVVDAAVDYLPWACAIPLCGVMAFIFDGIFIGITATRGMLISSATAAACFFAVYFLLFGSMANNAVWLAFLVFLAMRGTVQAILLIRMKHKASQIV